MYKIEPKRLIAGTWQLGNPKIWVASIVPLMVGAAAAYMETRKFNLYWFLVSVAGVFLIELGKHAINEAVDYYTGVDRFVTADKQTPYSGGRRTIVDGKLTFLEVSAIGLLAMGAASLVGLYVVFFREFDVLWVGLAGYFIATFYTLPPLKFIYNGLGELAVGITYGPLIITGTYLVQAHTYSLFALLIALPIGFLITNVLWINQFPDYEADRQGNKKNWVVRLGKQKSVYVYAVLFLIPYILIALLALWSGRMLLLISLVTVPLAVNGIRVAIASQDDIPKLVKSNVRTIQVYLLTGVLLTVAMLIG